jgi:hypothetical protein
MAFTTAAPTASAFETPGSTVPDAVLSRARAYMPASTARTDDRSADAVGAIACAQVTA